MASCNLGVYAKDCEGNALPFVVSFRFYTLKDGAWDEWNLSPFTVPIGGSRGFLLDTTETYKIVPIKYSDECQTPPEKTFTGCMDGSHSMVYICVNGFIIRTSLELATKNVLVAHVVKMPFIGLVGPDPNLWYWPQAFDYVGGKWYITDPATTYRVEVGSVFETIPSFDKTYGTGSFADGIHCVVLAEGEGGVGSLIFKGEDVFQLFKDSPTEIFLSSTSTDVLTEVVMGPVCDFFGIPRDTPTEKLCSAFWAEFFDPVYVANYISIRQTGKDTLGNDRTLSTFDHIALPFAILGSLPALSLLPFGAIVTKGLGTISKTGAKFSDDAIGLMLDFSMDASNFVSSKDTWRFLDAIGQVTEEHATEIVNALTADDLTLADTLLRKYAGESKGWWDYHTLNDMLRDALPTDAYNWLRTQIGLTEIGAGTVTNTAKQATLSADDIAKLADAALDSGVMDEATAAVYNSIKNLDTASATKIDELKNILKNSPELSAKLVAKHKSILDNVVAGGSISKDEIATLLNHAEVAPTDIVGLFKSVDPSIVPRLTDGTYNQAFGNYIDAIKKHNVDVYAISKEHGESWVRNGAKISRKAMDSTDPAKMADIPHAAQEIAAKQDSIIDDAVADTPEVSKVDAEDIIFGDGMKVGDEIGEVTQVFADEVPTNWYTKARQRANIIPDRIKKKWKGLKRHEKVLIIWFMSDNMVFMIYMLLKYLGIGPGDVCFRSWNLGKAVTDWGWSCSKECTAGRYDRLSAQIEFFETAITDLEEYLDNNEFLLKLGHCYDAPKSVLDLGKSDLALMQECLVNRGIEVDPFTGKIEFLCEDDKGQPVICAAYVDDQKVGTVWSSGLLIEEVNPNTYALRMYATGYTECTKMVTVSAGSYDTFECIMTQIGVCSPVTDVKIYIDPLSPIVDETVSFNGSAKSDDPITTWEWNFGDSFTATGQAVTHPYSKAGIYTVKLIVTNDCESSESAMRNVTVSEEAPPVESTTLSIGTPIGTDGNEIPRYWEIEIWVDGKDTACNPPRTLTFGTNVFCDCTSPWNLVPCELGDHTITLKKSGYKPLSKLFYLVKDEPMTWNPVMVVSTGKGAIQLESNMPPFDGYVDGVFVGNSGSFPNIYIPNQTPGQHTVKVYKGPGYTPEYCEDTVTVVADELVVYRCDVTETKQHNIDLVIPAGAKLWVDGKLIETTVVGRLTTIFKDLRK